MMDNEQLPKGYKNTEVGVIPEDWDVKAIGKYTDVTSGGTPSTLIREYWDGPIRWMNSGELNLKIVYEVENRITELGLNESATKLVPKNCVLIGLAGQGKTRGTVAINKVELCTNQSIAAILPSDEVFYEYLYYNLDSRYFELRGLSTGDGGRGGLNLTIIKNLLIPLPPTKAEQTAIANALSDTDALINSLEKLIAKKRNIKQGTMQQLLKPKEGWKVKKLGEISDILDNLRKPLNDSERQQMKGDIPYCGANGIVDYVDDFVIDDDIILMAEDGGYFDEYKTRPIAYRMKGKCWVNNHAHILKAKKEIDQDFLFYSLVNKNILDFINGGTRAKLNKGELINILVAVSPSKEEQTRIATILSDMDAEIQALETKLEKYRKIKLGMMQNLLTGKIRLI